MAQHRQRIPRRSGRAVYDGTKLDGPISLRNAILDHKESFIGSFTESLMAYGLGRLLDHQDMPMVRAIEHDAAKNNNRFSSFVLGIVKSVPFQMRKRKTRNHGRG